MKDRVPEVRCAGDTPLLWITGCTVGAVHPCPESIETAQAWRALESACASASKWDSEGFASTEGRS